MLYYQIWAAYLCIEPFDFPYDHQKNRIGLIYEIFAVKGFGNTTNEHNTI